MRRVQTKKEVKNEKEASELPDAAAKDACIEEVPSSAGYVLLIAEDQLQERVPLK